MRSCISKHAASSSVVLAIFAIPIGLFAGRATAALPAAAASTSHAPKIAASARATVPRVLRITIPESSIRVYARETGQTSLNSARIHGLRIGSAQSTALSGDLFVSGGGAQDREFCVDIVRINNLFGLSFVFSAPSNADVYRLSLRTRAWVAQLPMTSGELSVRVQARSGGQCSGPLLAAGWESPGDSMEAWVPYNAGQASAARMQVGKGLAEACIAVKNLLPRDVQAVQYNFICKMPPAVARCGSPTTVQVQRDMGARSDPEPDRMDIRSPCLAAHR